MINLSVDQQFSSLFFFVKDISIVVAKNTYISLIVMSNHEGVFDAFDDVFPV